MNEEKFRKLLYTKPYQKMDFDNVGTELSTGDEIFKISNGAAFSILFEYLEENSQDKKNTPFDYARLTEVSIFGSKNEIIRARSLLEKILNTKLRLIKWNPKNFYQLSSGFS